MKLIICLLLLLFPSKVYANNYDLNVSEDEYNNIVISSNNLDYLNNIVSVEFYDGESTVTVDIIKENDINSSINEKAKTLTLYMSKLTHINSGSYKIYLNATGYEKLRADDMGVVIDKKIVNSPADVLVLRNENGLEIRSKVYNYIHGLTLEYMSENSLSTYSFIQFSKSDSFIDSIIYENTYSKLPFSSIYKNDDYYCVSISNDALISMGFEEDVNYYIQVQSASFTSKDFGSYLLVEKDEELNEDKLDDDLINRPNFEEDVEVEEEIKKKDDSDLMIAISCFFAVLIGGAITYIIYMKNKSKK